MTTLSGSFLRGFKYFFLSGILFLQSIGFRACLCVLLYLKSPRSSWASLLIHVQRENQIFFSSMVVLIYSTISSGLVGRSLTLSGALEVPFLKFRVPNSLHGNTADFCRCIASIKKG
ncbi:unnamed protein product [Lepeophtheirus salmonis]|uniref:(salmon louse) hypothetical protein n=1 Tax=Lepeophtheirus salmonis TaxID=72036 RepID=A0A7R8CNF9_LEPSM|nr:unnamed protein product [Lepeophtheirus salmonis]CAF2872055.1 unnamed protein product [Lepeophtheirus salmonis]